MNVRATSSDKKIEVYFNSIINVTYLSVPDKNNVNQVCRINAEDVDSIIDALQNFKRLMTASMGEGALK